MALIKVKTKSGWVEGLPAGNQFISCFRGIPYAAPPVGDLRWRRPQPAKPWDGVLQCYKFRDRCLQEGDAIAGDDGGESLEGNDTVDNGKGISACHVPGEGECCHYSDSEDCLYLSIWTPAESDTERLPVAVWFHGGGLYTGCDFENIYDGEGFAKRGLVYVSVTHRLNVFGFFAHPDLAAEDPDHSTGNYGMLDLVEAIKWIRENIAAFGGDPDHISIFGQSGGADKVQTLVCSPLTRGMISGAVMHSAGGIWDKGNTRTTEENIEMAKDFLRFMGADSIAEARRIPGKQVLKYLTEYHWSVPDPVGFVKYFFPVIDGYFMEENANDAILAGHHPDIAYMIGCTSHEFYYHDDRLPEREQVRQRFAPRFGEWTDRVVDSIHLDDPDVAHQTMDNVMGEEFVSHALAWNENQVKYGRKNSYSYYLTLVPPGLDLPRHGEELIYIFQTLSRSARGFTGRDWDLSNQLCEYWSNFFKYGDPNGRPEDRTAGVELPEWRPYTAEDPGSMIIDYGPHMGTVPESDFRRTVKEFILQQPHW